MASRDDDKAMAGLLRKSLAADTRASVGKDCPAPEILAAYFERALDAEETARYDLHFSQCSHCREQLAAMARAAGELRGERKVASGGWTWLRAPRWLAPAAAAFALLVLIAGIGLRHAKRVEVASEIAPLQPNAVPLPAAQGPASESAAPPAPRAPAANAPAKTTSRTVAGEAGKASSAGVPQERALAKIQLRPVPSNAPKKSTTAYTSDSQNAPQPEAPAAGAASSAENAVVVETPPASTETVEVVPEESRNRAAAGGTGVGVQAEDETKALNVPRRKTAAKAGAAAPEADEPSAVVSSFAARSDLESAEKARMREAQMSSNLAGVLVHTPDAKVLWTVSDAGSVGRSEDGGATWKYKSLETVDRIVAGSAPTAKICWLLGEHGALYRTTDGKTWDAVPPPRVAGFGKFTGIEAQDALAATVTTANGQKFSTSDAGKTWNLVK
jgi:Photosynthesis system II assembly factor YCF48